VSVSELVTLDRGAFARWKQWHGKPDTATISDLREAPGRRHAVQEAVDRANTAVSRAEGIRRFRILPGTFEVGAQLAPTQMVRRDYVLAEYASEIDGLCACLGTSGRVAMAPVPGRSPVKKPKG